METAAHSALLRFCAQQELTLLKGIRSGLLPHNTGWPKNFAHFFVRIHQILTNFQTFLLLESGENL